MKKKIFYILILIGVGATSMILMSNKTVEKVAEKAPYVSSMSKSVDVPQQVKFAGEDIDLSRYDMHERFDREINGFSYLHSTTLLLIKKANRYFPMIEPILKKNGIPDDFKYLAVIESNLNHRAVSPAKAAGLWQFMPRTATEHGLEVRSEVDERYSIEKSTEAACQYFNAAYAKYGKWSDVALSYNAGQGRITTELEKQQAEEGLDLWLVDETARYFFRMMAIKLVFEHPYQYGFVLKANQLYKPMVFREVEVSESVEDLAEFAKNNGITYAQLKDFNSWLRDRKLTILAKGRKSYTLLIPTEESLVYKKNEQVKVHNKNWVSQN